MVVMEGDNGVTVVMATTGVIGLKRLKGHRAWGH